MRKGIGRLIRISVRKTFTFGRATTTTLGTSRPSFPHGWRDVEGFDGELVMRDDFWPAELRV